MVIIERLNLDVLEYEDKHFCAQMNTVCTD